MRFHPGPAGTAQSLVRTTPDRQRTPAPVQWRGGSLSDLNTDPIRLRIRLENADLYSLRFNQK